RSLRARLDSSAPEIAPVTRLENFPHSGASPPAIRSLPMRTLRILSTVACALVGLALVASIGAASPRRHHSSARKSAHKRVAAAKIPAPTSGIHVPGSAGMVIAVDPESGRLRMPTPEELQALYVGADDPLNFSSEGLVSSPTPKGGVWVDVQGRF